jgi:lipid-binding SYLF domain-containing protein
MKSMVLGILLVNCVITASAIDKAELDNRVRTLTAKFEALQQQPDKAIPAENLRKAQGIILLDRTKAGFLFAYQGGGGVAMTRDKAGKWSPTGFLSTSEASIGFQIGGEQNFFVILLMTTNANRLLTESSYDVGGEARGTAGEQHTGVEVKTSTDETPVLVYDDRKGLFGGASVKGGALTPDDEANRVYYGKTVSMRDILFDKKVKPTEAATDLATKITERSKSAKK